MRVGVHGGDVGQPGDAPVTDRELLRGERPDERHDGVTAAPQVLDHRVTGRSGDGRGVPGVELVHEGGAHLDRLAPGEPADPGTDVLVGVGHVVDDHPHAAGIALGEGARVPPVRRASGDELDQPLARRRHLVRQLDGVAHDDALPARTMATALATLSARVSARLAPVTHPTYSRRWE